MKKDRKADVQRLARDLQKSGTYEANIARELVDLLYEEVKDGLVAASGDEMLKMQGEARALERLYKKLTTEVPGTTTQEQ